MTAAVAIVAHPARLDDANALSDRVQADYLSLDHESRGERWNHQHALAALIDTDADWLVLLEDDAVPCSDFRDRLDDVLATAPGSLVSLYLGTGRWAGHDHRIHAGVVHRLIARADRDGTGWIRADGMWHAVGIAVRREQAKRLLRHLRSNGQPTDQAISAWCKYTRTPVHYTHPSLVDHADGPTVTDHPDKQPRREARRAWRMEA